jgi:TonB family protein
MIRLALSIRNITAIFLLLCSLTAFDNGRPARAAAQQRVQPIVAPPELLTGLNSSNPAERRNAANRLGGMRARDTVPLLIKLLLDKEASVREAAAFALGQMTDPRAMRPLISALSDKDQEVRASAAFALGMIGDRKAIPALSNALGENSVPLRSSALVALGLMHDQEAFDEFIDMLDDPSIDARYDAVWAMGQIEDPEAIDHLYAALVNLDLTNISDDFLEAYRQVVQNSLERLKGREDLIAGRTRPRRAVDPSGALQRARTTRPISVSQSVHAATTERALRAKIKGTVAIKALVGADGYVVRAYVMRRLGYGLDQRAVEAVMQYRFDPAMYDGLPQTTWVEVEVKF